MSETRYGTLQRFRAYLLGHTTKVYTVHAALKALWNTPHPSGKLARWGMAIQEIAPEIRYRCGRKNGYADALSRAPVDTTLREVTGQDREEERSSTGSAQPALVVDSTTPTRDVGVAMTDNNLPEVAQEQRVDPFYQDVVKYLEEGTLPTDEFKARKIVMSRPRFDLLDGILCYVDPRPPYRIRIAVPERLRPVLLVEAQW